MFVLYTYAPTATHTHTTHTHNQQNSQSVGQGRQMEMDRSQLVDGWMDAGRSFFLPLCVSSCLSVCLSSLAKSGPHAAHTNTGKAGQKQPASQPGIPLGRAKAKTPPTQPNPTQHNTQMKQTSLARSASHPGPRTHTKGIDVRNHKQLKSGHSVDRSREGPSLTGMPRLLTQMSGCASYRQTVTYIHTYAQTDRSYRVSDRQTD